MRPKQWSFTPSDDSLTGFVSNATGATWTLSTTTPNDTMAHLVSVVNDSANDHSAKTVALVGTDVHGKAQTETMALGAGSATVVSTKYFKTLTTATPSATINADTMDVGWTDDVISATFIPDFKQAPFNMAIGVDISGTISYDIQHTFDDPFSGAYSDMTWFDHSTLAAKTADADGNYAAPVRGIRVLLNSLTATATLKVTFIQGGVS